MSPHIHVYVQYKQELCNALLYCVELLWQNDHELRVWAQLVLPWHSAHALPLLQGLIQH